MKIKDMIDNQPEVLKLLKKGFDSNLLSHAYLFAGEEGSGMYEMAIYMSMMLLCESDSKPCFKCHNCIRISKNNHLNVNIIEPINDLIRREQIDSFIQELTMTSLEAGPQIGIIKDADKMNTSAENALLKVLEEPAPNHYIFLITTNPDRLLDTIISRTQEIRFKPLPRKFIIDSLRDSGIELDMTYILSYLTNDLDSAMSLIKEGKIYDILNIAKELSKQLATGKDPYVYFYKNGDMLKKEQDKKYHRIFLDMLQLINKEIINVYNANSKGYFSEVTHLYEKETICLDKILKMMEVINNYQERLNYYINMNLFYSSLLVELTRWKEEIW